MAYRGIGDVVGSLVKLAAVSTLVTNHCVDMTNCVGPSMYPTFNVSGDLVVLCKLPSCLRNIERGDIVIAKSPTKLFQTVCKRILGMEGDVIRIPPMDGFPNERILKIPKGHVFIEGDNPSDSTDSRYYGAIPKAMIVGKVMWKLWPLHEFGPISKSYAPGTAERQERLAELVRKRQAQAAAKLDAKP